MCVRVRVAERESERESERVDTVPKWRRRGGAGGTPPDDPPLPSQPHTDTAGQARENEQQST